jgi:hypothetical protein
VTEHERPIKPPAPTQLVIWACPELTPARRILWYHTWLLDNDVERACHMKPKDLAPRCQLSESTIEDYRGEMANYGLMGSWQHPEVGRVWRAMIDPKFFLHTWAEAAAQHVRYAQLLADQIRSVKAWRSGQLPLVQEPGSHGDGRSPPTTIGERVPRLRESHSHSGRGVEGVGGGGFSAVVSEAKDVVVTQDRQRNPRDPEEAVIARANNETPLPHPHPSTPSRVPLVEDPAHRALLDRFARLGDSNPEAASA